MASWQLQQAKQRLSEVVRRTIEEGPQVITRHGRAAVVVVAADEFERLRGTRVDFKEFLRKAPDIASLKIARSRTPARRVRL